MKHRNQKKRGFSLLEVLFAMILVATSVVIVGSAMPTANGSRHRADLNNKATSMAQKVLEAVRGLGYASLTPDMLFAAGMIDSKEPAEGEDTYSFHLYDKTVFDNPALILPEGEGYITVQQADLDLRSVVIEVRYEDRGSPRSVQLGTLVANL